MHMISNKDLSNAEMDTLTKSCSPTVVSTANGQKCVKINGALKSNILLTFGK